MVGLTLVATYVLMRNQPLIGLHTVTTVNEGQLIISNFFVLNILLSRLFYVLDSLFCSIIDDWLCWHGSGIIQQADEENLVGSSMG